MLIIGLGTENLAKKTAVKSSFHKMGQSIELISLPVDSGVSSLPKSDEETITGAINRAKYMATKFSEYDYYIGLEGGIEQTDYGTFLCNWAAIINNEGIIGIGGGPRIQIPEKAVADLFKGKELSNVINDLTQIKLNNSNWKYGTMGVLSQNLITRQKAFHDAILCAMSCFYNSESFYK